MFAGSFIRIIQVYVRKRNVDIRFSGVYISGRVQRSPRGGGMNAKDLLQALDKGERDADEFVHTGQAKKAIAFAHIVEQQKLSTTPETDLPGALMLVLTDKELELYETAERLHDKQTLGIVTRELADRAEEMPSKKTGR